MTKNDHPLLLLDGLPAIPKAFLTALLPYPEGVSQGELLLHGPQLVRQVSQPTASRVLAALAKQGWVIKTGATKGARFALNPERRRWVIPAQARLAVFFDPDRIENYQPGKTFWLSAQGRVAFEKTASPSALALDTWTTQISERFLIDLSWASSHLEGNTYSWLDTQNLLLYGQARGGGKEQDKARMETTMILNHKRAIEDLLQGALAGPLTTETVKAVHARLMEHLLVPAALGTYRKNEVRISGSAYRPSSNQDTLADAVEQLVAHANACQDPYEASFLLTAGLPYIQAFEDGNKRLGRLLGNWPLLRAGLPPMSFVDVNTERYLKGMIVFYETGDGSVLEDTLLTSYQATAGAFVAQHAARRMPTRLEIQHADAIKQYVKDSVAGSRDGNMPEGLTHEEQHDFLKACGEILDGISVENAFLWGVGQEDARRWTETRATVARTTTRPKKPR